MEHRCASKSSNFLIRINAVGLQGRQATKKVAVTFWAG